MTIDFNSQKSTPQQLLDQISDIAQYYKMLFDKSEEIKALQGLERCVELMMKICGIDGKQPLDPVPTTDRTISLAELPLDLLQQIINHTKTLPMQQHE